jgi:Mn-dependent DtxR family transcriptional regulator
MRLTKSTSHAIRILIDCAQADARLVKVAELSERLQITQQNVFKIVNLLARAHLIEAVRGPQRRRAAGAARQRDPDRRRRARHGGHASWRSRRARAVASRNAAA